MFAYIEQDSFLHRRNPTGISCNVDCRKNSIEEFAEKTPGIYSCQCSFHGIDVGFTWIE